MHDIDGAFCASRGLATVVFGKNAQYSSIFSDNCLIFGKNLAQYFPWKGFG